MDSFIDNLRNWITDNLSRFMTGLVVPVGAMLLVAAAIFCVISGILKLRGQKDDFKMYFIGAIACIAGAVLLGMIWAWGLSAAGV